MAGLFGFSLDKLPFFPNSFTDLLAWHLDSRSKIIGTASCTPLCATSTSPLTNALQSYPTAALSTDFTADVTSGSPATLGASAVQLAHGTGSNVVTVRYKQAASSSDQLVAGCVYTETTTLTIQ